MGYLIVLFAMGWVMACGVSAEAAKAFVARTTDRINVHDIDNNNTSATITTPFANGSLLAISPDGSKLYATQFNNSGVNNQIVVIDCASNTVLKTITLTNGVNMGHPAMSYDGKRLLVPVQNSTASSISSLAVVDTQIDAVSATIDLSSLSFNASTFARNIAIYGYSNKVFLIHGASQTQISLFSFDAKAVSGTRQLTGKFVIEGTGVVVDVEYSAMAITPTENGCGVYIAARNTNWSLDDKLHLFQLSYPGMILKELAQIDDEYFKDEGGEVCQIAAHPNSKYVYMIYGRYPFTTVVGVFDKVTRQYEGILSSGWAPHALAFTPDGTKLLVGSYTAGCQVYNTSSNTIIDNLEYVFISDVVTMPPTFTAPQSPPYLPFVPLLLY